MLKNIIFGFLIFFLKRKYNEEELLIILYSLASAFDCLEEN